jgi:CubicO group peptidase (beta-lactamase class C family)
MTAMVVMSLMEDGVLDVDAPAVHYFPEFGRHGKDKICLRHLLNHTAGIEDMPKDLDREGFLENGRLSVETLAELRPKQAPGLKVAYHPMTSWLVLNEVIERVTGQDLRQLLKTKFLSPLGFERLNYGVPEEDISLVAKHAHTGPPVISLMNRVFERTVGLDPGLIELSNEPRFLTGLHPSANVIGTAFETARFMQMLLNGGELDGVRVLQEDTVRRAVTEVTQSQIDGTFLMPVKYGLGTMVGGKLFSFFGMGTQGAFGHLGFSTVVVYADPRRDLCVALLNSGKPMLALGMLRWLWVLQRIALIVRPKGGLSP